MASVSALVSNTTFGPGYFDVLICPGSGLLLCPAHTSQYLLPWEDWHSTDFSHGELYLCDVVATVHAYVESWPSHRTSFSQNMSLSKAIDLVLEGKIKARDGNSDFPTDGPTEPPLMWALQMSSCQYLRSQRRGMPSCWLSFLETWFLKVLKMEWKRIPDNI